MVANHEYTRIDTLELKDLIYQKIGHQRAEEYFEQLRRFLWSKLSKFDFNKSCIRTFGQDNIRLHNLLIRAIIKNSNLSKPPPQRARKVKGLGVNISSGHQKGCFQSLFGNGFPVSPCKCRSPIIWERKLRDRPSPLGPLGKSPSLIYEETLSRIQEKSAADLQHSISSKPPNVVALVEEGEEVEQFSEIPREKWRSVTAPLGVSVKPGLTRKTLRFDETCQSRGELPDTSSLWNELEKKLTSEGFSISVEGVNAINKGIDVFLKRILKNCIPFGHSNPNSLLVQPNGQMLPGSNGISHEKSLQIQPQPSHLSMIDILLAMETNPYILGENWSSQLEKIRHHTFQ